MATPEIAVDAGSIKDKTLWSFPWGVKLRSVQGGDVAIIFPRRRASAGLFGRSTSKLKRSEHLYFHRNGDLRRVGRLPMSG
jgi:hypothetical protein